MGLPERVTGIQLNEHDKYLLRYRCRLFRLAAFWARHLRSRCGLLTLDSDRIATKNDGLVLGGFCRADCAPPDRQSFRCYQSACCSCTRRRRTCRLLLFLSSHWGVGCDLLEPG